MTALPLDTELRHKDGLIYKIVAANSTGATLNHETGTSCISRRLTWREVDRDFKPPDESQLALPL
jgi:hypothetical protein